MLSYLRQTSLPTALALCMALLAVWGSGAHAHRRIDSGHAHSGSEFGFEVLHHDVVTSASQLVSDRQISESNLIHAPHKLTPTSVEDVQLVGLRPSASMGKLPSLDLPPVILFFGALTLLLVLPSGRLAGARESPPRPLSNLVRLRPPLRGPPLFSVV